MDLASYLAAAAFASVAAYSLFSIGFYIGQRGIEASWDKYHRAQMSLLSDRYVEIIKTYRDAVSAALVPCFIINIKRVSPSLDHPDQISPEKKPAHPEKEPQPDRGSLKKDVNGRLHAKSGQFAKRSAGE